MHREVSFHRYLPAPGLRSDIAYYWHIDSLAPRRDDRLELSLPDAYAEIIFNFSDPYLRKNIHTAAEMLVERSNVVGMRTMTSGSMRARPNSRLQLLGVKLYPWALSSVASEAAEEFLDQVVDARDLPRSRLAELEDKLRSTANMAQRIKLLNTFFLKQLSAESCESFRLRDSLQRWAARPEYTVREMAHSCGMSVRTLERRYRTALGSTPKKVQRILRFNRWLADATTNARARKLRPPHSFTDQSHLIRECRYFLGSTPGQIGGANTPFTLTTLVT